MADLSQEASMVLGSRRSTREDYCMEHIEVIATLERTNMKQCMQMGSI